MSRIEVIAETWPLRIPLVISRERFEQEHLVVVQWSDADGRVGWGESNPQAHDGETVATVAAQIDAVRDVLLVDPDRETLRTLLPPGAARNALDCALWDLESKRSGRPLWQLADTPPPSDVVTAYTLSLDTPEAMARQASDMGPHPLLKLKLGGGFADDLARTKAVRKASEARFIVDANEGWDINTLNALAPHLSALGVEMIEQPLPAADDFQLDRYTGSLPLCADESCHHRGDLGRCRGRYRAINLKLDKSGGLTEALALARAAMEAGFELMVGTMGGTSLAMRPALVLAGWCRHVDLDGPLLLAEDREPRLTYVNGRILVEDQDACREGHNT